MQLLRQLETVAEPDVLVVGAGCAGTTAAIAAARRGDRVTAVVLANKKGLTAVKPRTVVDASGDADVAAFAGAPFDLGPGPLQPMSLHFRAGPLNPTADLRRRCGEVLEEAHREGRLGLYAGPWMSEVEAGDLYFNATRIGGDPLDPDDLSRAEMQGREDARLMFELFKEKIPEFKDACFITSGPMVGVRESRRIHAARTLRLADIEQQRGCDDVVCLGAWWLDRHPRDRSGYHPHTMVRPYDISYGTLVPRELANVWVAGRCHGAEAAALASSRVTVTCMGMGQAAGTAAALAAAAECAAAEVETGRLQAALIADGAIILERADAVRRVGDELGTEEMGSASR